MTTERVSSDKPTARSTTEAAWYAEGRQLFGDDMDAWRFVCPCCKHIASVKEWKDAGVPNQAAFSCIGRATGAKREAFGDGAGPCNYAGGGLFQLNPVHITTEEDSKVVRYMEFATP